MLKIKLINLSVNRNTQFVQVQEPLQDDELADFELEIIQDYL